MTGLVHASGDSWRRPDTLHEFLGEEIMGAILDGSLKAGERVSPEKLAQQFNVSHIPVREALARLEAIGHVRRISRRGFFVADMSVFDLEDIYRWRRVLQGEAHRLAIPLFSSDDLGELKLFHERIFRAISSSDHTAFGRTNREFHFAIYAKAGSDRLVRYLTNLWNASLRYQALRFRTDGEMKRVGSQCAALLRAIESRDIELANELDAKHIEATVALVKDWIADRGSGE